MFSRVLFLQDPARLRDRFQEGLMGNKTVGVIILLVASVAAGALCGNIFFGLFTKTVPPAVLTSFNEGTAHVMFISYGLGMGVGIFLWSLLAMAGSKLFRGKKRAAESRV
jgi:ABC-type Na+ efflux pump permease subunit